MKSLVLSIVIVIYLIFPCIQMHGQGQQLATLMSLSSLLNKSWSQLKEVTNEEHTIYTLISCSRRYSPPQFLFHFFQDILNVFS